MGIEYNKDGSMTITLDENNNLPQSLLGNPILIKEIDDLMAARDSSNQNPNQQPEGPTLLDTVMSEDEESNLLNFLQKGVDANTESELSQIMNKIVEQAEGPDKNAAELAIEDIVKNSNIDIKSVPPPPLSKEEQALVDKYKAQGYGDKFIQLQLMKNKILSPAKDVGNYLKEIYKDYSALAMGTGGDDYIQYLKNKKMLEDDPGMINSPSGREIQNKIYAYEQSINFENFLNKIMDDDSVIANIFKDTDDKTDTKKDDKKDDSKSTDGSGKGQGLSEFIASKMKSADSGDETPKDERTKIQKIMDGLLSKDDFLMDLGLRLIEGEGLFPGAIKAAKTQKAADTAEAKAELDAKLADSLIKERLSPADILQIAQVEAANVNPDPTSAEYREALNTSIIRQTSKSKDELSPSDLLLLTMISGGDVQAMAQNKLNSINNQNVAGNAVENFKAYNVPAAAKS